MSYKAVPQNTGGKEHFCGHCTLGCGAAEKEGPVVSWLPDAQRAGARFAEGFTVERVLFEDVGGKKTAVGIKGVWKSRNKKGGVDGPDSERVISSVIVKAKKVIVSAGTLWSPIILQNSGLTVSLLFVVVVLTDENRINTSDKTSIFIPSTSSQPYSQKTSVPGKEAS